MAGISPAMTRLFKSVRLLRPTVRPRPPRHPLEERVLHPAELPHADRAVERPLVRLPGFSLAMQESVIERGREAVTAPHAGQIFVEPVGRAAAGGGDHDAPATLSVLSRSPSPSPQ